MDDPRPALSTGEYQVLHRGQCKRHTTAPSDDHRSRVIGNGGVADATCPFRLGFNRVGLVRGHTVWSFYHHSDLRLTMLTRYWRLRHLVQFLSPFSCLFAHQHQAFLRICGACNRERVHLGHRPETHHGGKDAQTNMLAGAPARLQRRNIYLREFQLRDG